MPTTPRVETTRERCMQEVEGEHKGKKCCVVSVVPPATGALKRPLDEGDSVMTRPKTQRVSRRACSMLSSGRVPSDSQRRRGGHFVTVHGMFLEKVRVHQVAMSGLQVVTNVHWWSPDMDGHQVVLNLNMLLILKCPI